MANIVFSNADVQEMFECQWPEGDDRTIHVPGLSDKNGYRGPMIDLPMAAALKLEQQDPNGAFIKRRTPALASKSKSSAETKQ